MSPKSPVFFSRPQRQEEQAQETIKMRLTIALLILEKN